VFIFDLSSSADSSRATRGSTVTPSVTLTLLEFRRRSLEMDKPVELTLRAVPRPFRSLLLESARSWDLNIRHQPAHPWTFVPSPEADASRPQEVRDARAKVERRNAPSSSTRRVSWPRRESRDGSAVIAHAADRLARAIVLATASPSDPRTLTAWGQAVGVSKGALRAWCTAAGASARSCLRFLRVLRAVVVAESHTWDLFSILDVVDQRSLNVLLDRGGVREICRQAPPTVDTFIRTQRFLDNDQVLRAVIRRLRAPDDDALAVR
jgi:hypothetical protein